MVFAEVERVRLERETAFQRGLGAFGVFFSVFGLMTGLFDIDLPWPFTGQAWAAGHWRVFFVAFGSYMLMAGTLGRWTYLRYRA